MTRTTYARLAGFMFLFYIVTGIANMVLFRRATGSAEGIGATLGSLAQHATTVRLAAVLTLATFVEAVVLAVALYALTHDQDAEVALLALCFRVTEGVIAAVSAVRTLGLLSVATASTGAGVADAAAQALGALLLNQGGGYTLIGATSFAAGSTLYCYLFLRGRSIPIPLAWLGVFASVLLAVFLPLQLAGLLRGPATYVMWIPMAVFEVTLGLWLLTKGVATAPKSTSPELGIASRHSASTI